MRPSSMSSKTLILVLTSVVVIGAGCGSEGQPAASSPDAPVSSTPGGEAPGPGGPQRVTPRSGLVDVHATVWDRSRTRAHGKALDLLFWSGVEECYGVDRVEVEYKKHVVRATIFEGRVPEADTCIELAVRKMIRVHLDEPLAGRAVVDGNPRG